MREIKFRAWDKNGNRMLYYIPLYAEEAFDVLDFANYLSYELMQYTGLKDKNGKEIYEGDWCRAEFRTKEGIQVIQGHIIMDDFMWCIDCTGSVGDTIFSINRPYDFEIIGNIYENPELLQETP